jgi:hypothetical protein
MFLRAETTLFVSSLLRISFLWGRRKEFFFSKIVVGQQIGQFPVDGFRNEYLKAKALARRSKTALVNTFSWLHD